jgi:hypothetical protein
VDPSLFDSSPSTRHYVRRARRGSIVSTDSERTFQPPLWVPTPPSPLPESGGTAPTPIVIAAVYLLQQLFKKMRLYQQLLKKFLVMRRFLCIFLISQKVIIVESIPIDENLVIDTDFGTGVTQIEHAEVAASEDPVQADVIPGSDVPVIEEDIGPRPCR